MPIDQFEDFTTNLSAPARDAVAVTFSDTTVFATLPRALYVGQAGNLSVLMAGGQTVLFQGIQAGTVLAIRAARINATGSTAGSVVALW
jgi:hypothetical protein